MLPKIIIGSQITQNASLDTDLPTRKTRSSPTHQNTGTSPLDQEAYTTNWTKLTHQRSDTRSKRNYNPAAFRKETTYTVISTK